MNFALYSAGDAYSTEQKIMGRQSAGKALVRGVARRWPDDTVHAFGYSRALAEKLYLQLRDDGFSGKLRFRRGPGDEVLEDLGAVYYPAPLSQSLAYARNTRGPASYSLFGVTHTLSSSNAMDQISQLVAAPFKPWDALICTSAAALSVVTRLQDESREWHRRELGATRFSDVKLPVIPLGVDVPTYARSAEEIAEARSVLGLSDKDVVFLFAGRLSFHAKANPAAQYQALEEACQRTDSSLVCIEAGIYPNADTAKAFAEARFALAPSVRFIGVDGAVEADYQRAWRAADVFVSLSDNIQETFGLTPLEAMAAGQPVIVSDWDGYKDTVRDGIDGFRIPVTLSPVGSGRDLALRHAIGLDSYDYFIGKVSLATAIDIGVLTDRIVSLATEPALRRSLGAAGAERARQTFDWPVILDSYVELADKLSGIRRSQAKTAPEAWPNRPDPFTLFQDYPTNTLAGSWIVVSKSDAASLDRFLDLEVAHYAFAKDSVGPEIVRAVHASIEPGRKVGDLVAHSGLSTSAAVAALMWLMKFRIVELQP